MTKKRKSGDGDEEDGSGTNSGLVKVARQRLSTQETGGGQSRGWAVKPGMIMEVKMTNFMCHQTFTFNPNQKLTFLSGENGSGKSAVLTAIVFALGGNARVASRGNTNKAFIRTNQNSAKVEVRLTNVGETAYKPEVYGDSIRICRTVTQTTSTYKIFDHKGKPVVQKKHREELERILFAFNIQVDNPIAVLNQDTAKTFLFKCDPDKLYTFFMRATQLEACKQDYNSAHEEKEKTKSLLEDKINSLPALKKESDKWEKKYQFQMNLNDKKKELILKKAELAWASVRDLEEEKNESSSKIEVAQAKIDKCNEKLNNDSTNEKDLMAEKRKVEKEIQEIAQSEANNKAKVERLQAEVKTKYRISKELQDTLYEVKRNHQTKVNDLKNIEEHIENLKSQGTDEYDRKHKQRMDNIRRLRDEVDNVNAEVTTTDNHYKHLYANVKDAETKVLDLKAHKTRASGKTVQIQSELERLKSSGKNKLAAYGTDICNVVNEINKNARRFKAKPIGPLGMFVKIRENTPEDIIRALDHEMAPILSAFLVSCSQDQKELFNIFQRLRVSRKPSIYTCPFTNQKHNIENNRVFTDRFAVLIDFLDIEEPNVFNRVIDACSLERILYISNTQDAQDCLSRRDSVPRNTVYATVANSYHYYPAPNYRSYHFDERRSGLLKASVQEYIEQLKQQLAEQAEKEKQIEQAIRDANDEKLNHQKEAETCGNRVRGLNNKIKNLNLQIVTIKNEDATDQPPDISALEDDVERRKKELEAISNNLEARSNKFNDASDALKEAKEAFSSFRNELNSKYENSEPLNAKLQELENKIKNAKRNREHFAIKISEYQATIKNVEKDVAALDEKLVDLMNKALHWSKERVETRRKAESLRREIIHTEETLKQQELTQESRQVVTDNFKKYRGNYDRANNQIKKMSDTLKFLTNMLDVRKKGFKEIRNNTCKNISANFSNQLDVRNYMGRLVFDHKDHSLHIHVNPNQNENSAGLDVDRDIRNLSGGEKSYSSVSLILALWESMTPPFRVLDEFDVFMDSVNRRIAIQNILNFARIGRKYQFVFLTPLGTDNIDTNDDVKIIKLSKIRN